MRGKAADSSRHGVFGSAGIRCPACIVVSAGCDPALCRQECRARCAACAIGISQKAVIDSNRCTNCGACIASCPLGVIDKAETLFRKQDSCAICTKCGQAYHAHGNVWQLYPRNFNNEQYREFYETFENRLDPWQRIVARQVKVKNILKLLGSEIQDVKSLFDIGCSAGWVIDGLKEAHAFRSVFGLDLSGSVVKDAARRDPGAVFIAGDCEYLPFGKDTFDLSLALDVIEHISSPVALLREVSRVSKKVVLKIPLEDVFENFVWEFFKKVRFLLARGILREHVFEQHINVFTKKKAKDLLSDSGLSVIRSAIPDNPWKAEYTAYYFASPARTMSGFGSLARGYRMRLLVKYYSILAFRRIVFLLLRPLYHYFCYSSLYVYCEKKDCRQP